MTPDDLTITEKVLSATQPGSEWAWLVMFGLLVLFVAISESRRRSG
jgi:hypothetical protein